MTRKSLWLLICSALLVFIGCQKAPQLTITSPPTVDMSVDGSRGTITFTANRDWTISTSDSWITVSPKSGEASKDPVSVTVSCNANTTYEDRTATVTIRMEELTQTVTIKQPANLGIILPTKSFNLESGSNSFNVEVQANVPYSVSSSVDWIKQTGTKALTSTTYVFSVEENASYDDREGTVIIKSQNSSVPDQVITVRQAQKDALIVKDKSFDMPYGGGEIEFKVEANVDFDVTPSEDWIHHVETKALSNSTVRLTVDENPTYSKREGKIEIKQKNGSLSHTITVKQAERIAVTSITLDQTSITLKPEETTTLVAIVKPDNATDKTVTWSSSDPDVATVDDNGKVNAIKIGSATITAKAGEKTAECSVSVCIPVTSIELNLTSLKLKEGETATLVATVKPDDATFKEVTWTTSNEAVAVVDKDGTVTAVKEGPAKIIAQAGEKTATCEVTVKNDVPVTSIVFDKTSLSLVAGEQVTLTATIKPDDATDKTLTWSSTNDQVASVDDKGRITALAKGNAEIVATSATSGGVTAYCKVFVKAKDYAVPTGGVDLGLSVMWAEKNYGAYFPSDVGGYYVWGDPTGTAKIATYDAPAIDYISGTQYDVARNNLGRGWRLPTMAEVAELLSSCSWDATTLSGVRGVTFTGPNGNSIFIPLSGMGFPQDGPIGSYSLMSTDNGFLMTGESKLDSYGNFAYVYYFDQYGSYNRTSYNAWLAVFPVRPVYEKLEDDVPVSSLALNKTRLEMAIGDLETLIALVSPDDATDNTVTWSSSDPGVVTVDHAGTVTAIKEGTATITAICGGKTALCSVSVDDVITLNRSGANLNCYIISNKGRYRINCSNEMYDGIEEAFLLWNENGKQDIEDIELRGDYVYFEKPEFKKGNAMISVTRDSKIVNSWHIWSTDEPKFIDGVMDRNLGATSSSVNDVDAYGLLFSYGSPFPFPGAKYNDWALTSEPSVPDGWYVADGYGFYMADKMPTEDTPMMYCTNKDKYGNSIFWRNPSQYSPCPEGTYVLNQSMLQELIGYEPAFNGLNGVLLDSGLFIPAAGYSRAPFVSEVDRYGAYWGSGKYNNAAVDARSCWFYEGFSKASSYFVGNTLHSIRVRRYDY